MEEVQTFRLLSFRFPHGKETTALSKLTLILLHTVQSGKQATGDLRTRWYVY